ncbi:MAG: contractile injection system protein, VgrG/Pvc8 family, partial [Elainellaceae cyanobacterium]
MSPSSTMNDPIGSYQSLPDIEIDGDRNPPKVMDDLLQVIVEESLHLPAMFTLVLRNDYQPVTPNEEVWKHQDLLKMGKTVKIGLVPGTASDESSGQSNGDRPNSNRPSRASSNSDSDTSAEKYLIEGEITAIETHFSDRTQAPIVIRGYDVSHRLQRGRFNRSFQNMTDTDIVKKVIDEVGIKAGEIDESGIPHDYVFQENQTNMAFLRDRAARLGYELFVQDGTLNFRAPKSSETLNLKWLRDISNFRVRVTSAEQVKEVEVRGWDYSSKRPFVSTVQSEHLITETDNGQGKDSSSAFDKKPDNPKMLLVDRPMFQSKEADVMAQALYDELSGQYVHADAKGEGNPEIRPGRVVDLEDMGPHSGKY